MSAIPIIGAVVEQHVENSSSLYALRSSFLRGAGIRLRDLRRVDDRLAAHLDGLIAAGNAVWRYLNVVLERPSPGAVFAHAVTAVRQLSCDLSAKDQLRRLFALSESAKAIQSGLFAAFGWEGLEEQRNVSVLLLNSPSAFLRLTGVSAYGMNRADAGVVFGKRLSDESTQVRARAWRTAGELGKRELVSTAAAVSETDPHVRFWAAWAAVLLGDKESALDVLSGAGASVGPNRARAFQMTLQASSMVNGHSWLAKIGKDPTQRHWLIRGSGLIGDPKYIHWLIEQMRDPKLARVAGESFSLITGLDLAWLKLEVKRPESSESGPNDDPNDPNVDMDEDDGLPWPDVVKIKSWWQANAQNFKPGTRYFMGQPLNRDNCLRVLKEGFQRQRIAAAYYLSLLNPGTPLFEWRAPAWRQQRQLAGMS